MKRDPAQTIFRTVVFAGAMLGTGACGGKQASSTTPSNATPAPDNATPAGGTTAAPDPCAGQEDPCAGADPGGSRPRGDDPDGGGAGRGFVLS